MDVHIAASTLASGAHRVAADVAAHLPTPGVFACPGHIVLNVPLSASPSNFPCSASPRLRRFFFYQSAESLRSCREADRHTKILLQKGPAEASWFPLCQREPTENRSAAFPRSIFRPGHGRCSTQPSAEAKPHMFSRCSASQPAKERSARAIWCAPLPPCAQATSPPRRLRSNNWKSSLCIPP
jgi:hypothetical protein